MGTLQDAAASLQNTQQQVTALEQQLANSRAMFDQQQATLKDMLAKQEAAYDTSVKPLNDQLVSARSQVYDALQAVQDALAIVLQKPVQISVSRPIDVDFDDPSPNGHVCVEVGGLCIGTSGQ
jgi:hypothetical protein